MTEEIEYGGEYELIPIHMREGLYGYIHNGRRVGSFLAAVISNDLRETCLNADNVNKHVIFEYVAFLHGYAPMACWGSTKKYHEWCIAGGLNGRETSTKSAVKKEKRYDRTDH